MENRKDNFSGADKSKPVDKPGTVSGLQVQLKYKIKIIKIIIINIITDLISHNIPTLKFNIQNLNLLRRPN